jgi:hypothetical protein
VWQGSKRVCPPQKLQVCRVLLPTQRLLLQLRRQAILHQQEEVQV